MLGCVQLFVTPWTAAHQAPLSSTISWSLLKFVSIESVMPSNHLILCLPLLLLPSVFPSIRDSFPMSWLFASGGQRIGVSTSESVLPVFNIHLPYYRGFPGGSVVKNPPAKQEIQVQSLGQEDPLEKEMATLSNILPIHL